MKPEINVTPLIDVLLVLLIIFMVISPLKPAQFETQVPSEQTQPDGQPDPHTLVVRINSDETLTLNNEDELGTIVEPTKLSNRLNQIFAKRLENSAINNDLANDKNLSFTNRIQKTVFIKAPKSIGYGQVVKVIDELKLAGANPISLQIDDLEL